MSEEILKELNNKFCFKYDENSHKLIRIKSTQSSYMVFKELIVITELLGKNNIPFAVDKDENIEIKTF